MFNDSFPPRVRGRSLPLNARALLVKLRVGSVLVRERFYRQRRVDSLSCTPCDSCETPYIGVSRIRHAKFTAN